MKKFEDLTLKEYGSIFKERFKIFDEYQEKIKKLLDIKSPFDRSIHICLMGNYSLEVPVQRFYQQLAYRVVGPIIKVFHMNLDRIKLHSEVSKDFPKCPGKLFNKDVFIALLRSMFVSK